MAHLNPQPGPAPANGRDAHLSEQAQLEHRFLYETLLKKERGRQIGNMLELLAFFTLEKLEERQPRLVLRASAEAFSVQEVLAYLRYQGNRRDSEGWRESPGGALLGSSSRADGLRLRSGPAEERLVAQLSKRLEDERSAAERLLGILEAEGGLASLVGDGPSALAGTREGLLTLIHLELVRQYLGAFSREVAAKKPKSV